MERTPTVFLIDDDTDDHEIFSYAMEQADDSVHCVFAKDGIHALEKIKAEKDFTPDYIFLDMNMPRMNGQQCLVELKKIERLRNTPVFMYSTSAEPSVIDENIKLGAEEFILKPADINDLTKILSRIIRRNVISILTLMFCVTLIPSKSYGQADTLSTAKELKKLSVEQLMNIVVTSVSRSPEKLAEVASAIQVVTGEEIKRSGTLRLPGAIRLATNMQVSSGGAHDSRISSRGFNGFPVSNSSLADKLLVMIDGRTVYSPLFGGVYWDAQNVLQEDIKQIEAISGPGGSLWGANAINGIVNIISKSARETQGLYASGAGGYQPRDFGAVRYGSHVDTSFYYRVYAQRYDYSSTTLSGGIDAKDAWNMTQGGFRMDYYPSVNSTFTFQGDLYSGTEDDTGSTYINGQNVVGRWTYNYSANSNLVVQTYYDRTYRNITRQDFSDELNTFDIDLQHNIFTGKRNRVVWGLGYRVDADNINTLTNSILPANKTLQLFSGFVQDQFTIITNRLDFTIGTKVLHNDYTGFEFQPTARLAYTPNPENTIWTSVSRAVRTPSRFDGDNPSSPDFDSEVLYAYEFGYRVRPMKNVLFSIASFYNDYNNLRSIDSNETPPPPFHFGNHLEASTYGIEVSANAVATRWWKIRGGYTMLREKFKTTSPITYPQSNFIEAIDPKNQFLLQSLMDIAKHFQVDGTARYVDALPAAITQAEIPAYFTFDLRLAWNYKWLTISVAGQNLARKNHGSSGTVQIPRSGFAQLTLRF